MENSNHLWKQRTIKHNLDGWRRHKTAPGWQRDQIVAMEAYYIDECDTDLTEAVIMSPVPLPPTDVFYLSMLVEGCGAEPMQLDFGHGRFERPLVPGSLVFLDASVPANMAGQGPYHLMSMIMGRRYINSRLSTRFHTTSDVFLPLFAKAFGDEKICDLMTTLMGICRGAFAIYSQQELIDRILRRLIINSGQKLSRKVVAEEKLSDAMAYIVEYLERNYDRQLTRKQVAAEAGMSEGHLTRSFQAATGTSFTNYLYLYRLSKSRELMRKLSPEVSIAEIGERCGFATRRAFYQAFKRQYGIPPGEYRASLHS